MTLGPRDVPAQAISVADQTYADAIEDMNRIIGVLREGMKQHPQWDNSPSLLWYRSALDYQEKLGAIGNPEFERALHHHTANLMIAAMFRLAYQEEQRDPLEDMANE